MKTNSELERYSVAYSLCPSSDSQIGSCRKPSVYRKFTFGEYRKQVQEDIKRTGHKVGLPRFRLMERKISSDLSTQLVFYDNTWKIRKEQTKSDLDHLSRLLPPLQCLKGHVLPLMGKEMVDRVKSKEGTKIVDGDVNTGDEHRLMFRSWGPRTCLLNGGWAKMFVKGRGLKVGDEIGMCCDTVLRKFHFSVLHRVA